MKKIFFLITMLILSNSMLEARHLFLFRNADDITQGTLSNARIDASSITKRGQLTDGIAILTVGSITTYGTLSSSTGFKGGSSTFTSVTFGDGSIQNTAGEPEFDLFKTTAQGRIQGALLSNTTGEQFVNGWQLYRSTGEASNLFKSTGEAFIQGWQLYRSTGESANLFKSTGEQQTASYSLFKSTGEQSIKGWNLHKSTADNKIGSWSLFQSTGEIVNGTGVTFTSITSYGTFSSSTGFRGQGANLSNTVGFDDNGTIIGFARALKVTGAGNGGITIAGDTATLTMLDTTGGGADPSKNYYSLVIGTSNTGTNNRVDISTTGDFSAAVTSIVINQGGQGTVLVRRGTYTFNTTLEIPKGIEFIGEKGAVIQPAGNFAVVSSSGIFKNFTIQSTITWQGQYLLKLNASSYAENITFSSISSALVDPNAYIYMTGKNTRLSRLNVFNVDPDNTAAAAATQGSLMLVEKCLNCVIDYPNITISRTDSMHLNVRDSTATVIEHGMWDCAGLSCTDAIELAWNSANRTSDFMDVNTIFRFNTIYNAVGNSGGVFLPRFNSTGTVITDNLFIHNPTQNGDAIDFGTCRNCTVKGNYFYGWNTAINDLTNNTNLNVFGNRAANTATFLATPAANTTARDNLTANNTWAAEQ